MQTYAANLLLMWMYSDWFSPLDCLLTINHSLWPLLGVGMADAVHIVLLLSLTSINTCFPSFLPLSLCYPGLCLFLTINICSLSFFFLSITNFCQFFTANSSQKEKKKKRKRKEKKKEKEKNHFTSLCPKKLLWVSDCKFKFIKERKKKEKKKRKKKKKDHFSSLCPKKISVSFWLQIQIHQIKKKKRKKRKKRKKSLQLSVQKKFLLVSDLKFKFIKKNKKKFSSLKSIVSYRFLLRISFFWYRAVSVFRYDTVRYFSSLITTYEYVNSTVLKEKQGWDFWCWETWYGLLVWLPRCVDREFLW